MFAVIAVVASVLLVTVDAYVDVWCSHRRETARKETK